MADICPKRGVAFVFGFVIISAATFNNLTTDGQTGTLVSWVRSNSADSCNDCVRGTAGSSVRFSCYLRLLFFDEIRTLLIFITPTCTIRFLIAIIGFIVYSVSSFNEIETLRFEQSMTR